MLCRENILKSLQKQSAGVLGKHGRIVAACRDLSNRMVERRVTDVVLQRLRGQLQARESLSAAEGTSRKRQKHC